MNTSLFSVHLCSSNNFIKNYNSKYYSIFIFQGEGKFSIDFVNYQFKGNLILFLSPYQNFNWLEGKIDEVRLLQFDSEFYCIEYHKKEVACNGFLFNNIYLIPYIILSSNKYKEIHNYFDKMDQESKYCSPFVTSIVKSYLQLILALCSREKELQIDSNTINTVPNKEIINFKELLEKNFCTHRSPSYYASLLAISINTFSKKIKQELGKTPSQLIQERVILEAKKQLHLTHRAIKEIAADLNFEDEYYFSRYFKKAVGLSPTHYRENVGISSTVK